MPSMKLQSSDNKIFEIDVQIATKCSSTIKTALKYCDMEDVANAVVPLPNVHSAILRKVLYWIEYHKDDPQPIEDEEDEKKETYVVSSWDADFLKVDNVTLIKLASTANYFDIKGLLHIICQTLANLIKGKTSEEMRSIFDGENNFTSDEEEQVRNWREWCEEK